MKKFLDFSKRSLVLLLTGAMIFTSVPADILAAPAAAADDEAIIEEIVEEAADEVAVETPAIADVVDDDAAEDVIVEDEEEAADADVVDKDDYTDDVQFVFLNATEDGDDEFGTYTHVAILDGETRDDEIGFYGYGDTYQDDALVDISKAEYAAMINDQAFDFGIAATDLASAPAKTAAKKWDSDQDYVFTLKAEKGYVFDTYSKKASDQDDLKKRLVKIWWAADVAAPLTMADRGATDSGSVAAWTTDYEVAVDPTDRTVATVTIKASYLKAMRDKLVSPTVEHNNRTAGIIVAPYTTLNQADDKNHIRKAQDITAENDPRYLDADVDESLISWGWGAQPDSYKVVLDKLNGKDVSVPSEDLWATYDRDMWVWKLDENAEPQFELPITGAELYVTGAEKPFASTNPASAVYLAGAWNIIDQELTIPEEAVQYAYPTGITVKFLQNAYRITQDNTADLNGAKTALFFKDVSNVNGKPSISGLDKALADDGTNGLEQGVLAYYTPNAGRELGSIDVKYATADGKGKATAEHYLSGNLGSGVWDDEPFSGNNDHWAQDTEDVGTWATIQIGNDNVELTPKQSEQGKTVFIPRDIIAEKKSDMWVWVNTTETITYEENDEAYIIDWENALRTDESFGGSEQKKYETKSYNYPVVIGTGTLDDPYDYGELEEGIFVDELGYDWDMVGTTRVATVHLYTNEELTLPIYAGSNHKINSVKYVPEGGTPVEFTDNHNGTFTLAKGVLNKKGQIVIDAPVEASANQRRVRLYTTDGVKGLSPRGGSNDDNDLGVVLGNVTIKDSKYGVDLTGATGNGAWVDPAYATKVAGPAVTVSTVNTNNNPNFYFTVNPDDTKRYVVKKVSWRSSDLTDATNDTAFTELTCENTKTGLYRIPNPQQDIEILVEINKLEVVEMPSNPKVTVTINGKTYKGGATPDKAYVEHGVPFSFAVNTTSTNITVSEIGFHNPLMVGENARATLPEKNKQYTIAADDVTTFATPGPNENYTAWYNDDTQNPPVRGVIKLYAQTIEEVEDSTTGFNVRFTAANYDPQKAGSQQNWKWGPDALKALKDVDDGALNLRLNQNTAITLEPAIFNGKTLYAGSFGGANAALNLDGENTTYETARNSIMTIKKLNGDNTEITAVLDANKKKHDADSFTFSVRQKSKNPNKDENLVKVTGTQPVDVTKHFVIGTPASTDGWTHDYIYDVEHAYNVAVKNGATDDTIASLTNAKKIMRGTDGLADDKIGAWSSDSGTVHLAHTSIENFTTGIYADGAMDNQYELFYKITDTDGEVYKSDPTLKLWPVEYRNYVIIPELNITGGIQEGGRYFGVETTREIARNVANLTWGNSLGKNDLSKADLTFKVYELNKNAITVDIDGNGENDIVGEVMDYDDVDTRAALKLALSNPKGDDKFWAREVPADSITWYEKTDANGNVIYEKGYNKNKLALTVTGENGAYNLEATGTSLGWFDVKAIVGRIDVTQSVPFDTCVNTEMMKINLLLDDPVQVNDNGTLVNHKLSDNYMKNENNGKKIWKSVTDLTEVYDGNPLLAAGGIDENGYQFKLENGAQFTLPKESDFDDTIYTGKHKTRTLVGWYVIAEPGSRIGHVTPDEENDKLQGTGDGYLVDLPVDQKSWQLDPAAPASTDTDVYFFAPGATVTFLNDKRTDETYNLAIDVSPIWADRYELSAGAEVWTIGAAGNEEVVRLNNVGIYVDNGYTEEIDQWSVEAQETIKETVPRATAQMAEYIQTKENGDVADWTDKGLNETELATTISKTASTPVSPVLLKTLNDVATVVLDDDNALVAHPYHNLVFPIDQTTRKATVGTVTWDTFDVKKADGKDNILGGDVAATKAQVKDFYEKIQKGESVLTADEKDSLARKTVLDATELAKGNLKGSATSIAGDEAYVFAKYTDADGTVYWMSEPIKVTIAADQPVSVDITDIKDQTLDGLVGSTRTIGTTGLEVGQEVQVDVGRIHVTDGEDIAADANLNTGKYTWSVVPSDVLEIVENDNSKGTNRDALTPVIRALKKGTAIINLTYTSANGVSATTATPLTIEVKDAAYSLAFTDKTGAPVTSLEAKATKTAGKVGEFYVTVKQGTDEVVNGTLAFTSSEPTVVPNRVFVQNAQEKAIRPVAITIDDVPTTLGTTKITATYTATNGNIYKKTIDLNTYYEVRFGGIDVAGPNTDIFTGDLTVNPEIPNPDKVFTDDVLAEMTNGNNPAKVTGKVAITNSAKAVISDADTGVYSIKVFKDQIDEYYKTNKTKGYKLSIDGIEAKYNGTNSTQISFLGWTVGAPDHADSMIKDIEIPDATGNAAEYTGNLQMYANFGYISAQSILVNPTRIVLDAAGKDTPANGLYKANAENLRISVGPKDSNDIIKIKTSASGFFGYTVGAFTRGNDGVINPATVNPMTTAASVTLTDAYKVAGTPNAETQAYEIGIVTLGGTKVNNNGTPADDTDDYIEYDPDNSLAGAATLTVFSSGGKIEKTVEVVVTGLYTKDGKTHYMTATGEDAKNTSIKVGDDTYFFDENGDPITDGPAKDANGNDVIVKDGKAQKGLVDDVWGHTYKTDDNGAIQTGWVDLPGGKKGYAYPDDRMYLATDSFEEISGKLYYFDYDGALVTGDGKFQKINSKAMGPNNGEHEYSIGADGSIAKATLVPVEGGSAYVNSYGIRITAADVKNTNGVYTDPVTNAEYEVDENGFAKAKKEFFYTGYTLGAWEWNGGQPYVTVTMNYAAKDGEVLPTTPIELKATTTDGDDVVYKTYTSETTTATLLREGGSEFEVVGPFQKKFDKDGKSAEYTYSKHEFTWPKELGEASKPNVSATVTYTVTEDGVAKDPETIPTAVTVSDAQVVGKLKKFTATLVTLDGQTKTEEKSYNANTGKLGEGIVVEGLKDTYYYVGTTVKPAFALVDYDIEDGVVLGKGTDYTVSYKVDNKSLKNGAKEVMGEILVTGKGNYAGKKIKANFKVVNKAVSAEDKEGYATSVKKVAKISDKFTYNGEYQAPATITVNADGADITYNWDEAAGEYVAANAEAKQVFVSVENNKNAGTAVVAAAGTDGKVKKATFKIAKASLKGLSADAVTVNEGVAVAFSSKGAQPAVEVTFKVSDTEELELVQNEDFKVSYSGNKAVGSAATVTITGKNNFTGKAAKVKNFEITAFDLESINDDAVAINAFGGQKASAVKAILVDASGNLIPAKDLVVAVYPKDSETALGKKDKLAAGTEYTVKVTGKDAAKYAGEISVDITARGSIAKAKFVIDNNWKKTVAYTGAPVDLKELLDDADKNPFENGKIQVKIGSTVLEYGKDYEVVSYANNVKKGTMTFTIQGIGETYSGAKSGKTSIGAKTIATIINELFS